MSEKRYENWCCLPFEAEQDLVRKEPVLREVDTNIKHNAKEEELRNNDHHKEDWNLH